MPAPFMVHCQYKFLNLYLRNLLGIHWITRKSSMENISSKYFLVLILDFFLESGDTLKSWNSLQLHAYFLADTKTITKGPVHVLMQIDNITFFLLWNVKEKIFNYNLLKVVRQTWFRTITLALGTTVMEFYSGPHRLGTTLNTARASGKL